MGKRLKKVSVVVPGSATEKKYSVNNIERMGPISQYGCSEKKLWPRERKVTSRKWFRRKEKEKGYEVSSCQSLRRLLRFFFWLTKFRHQRILNYSEILYFFSFPQFIKILHQRLLRNRKSRHIFAKLDRIIHKDRNDFFKGKSRGLMSDKIIIKLPSKICDRRFKIDNFARDCTISRSKTD